MTRAVIGSANWMRRVRKSWNLGNGVRNSSPTSVVRNSACTLVENGFAGSWCTFPCWLTSTMSITKSRAGRQAPNKEMGRRKVKWHRGKAFYGRPDYLFILMYWFFMIRSAWLGYSFRSYQGHNSVMKKSDVKSLTLSRKRIASCRRIDLLRKLTQYR